MRGLVLVSKSSYDEIRVDFPDSMGEARKEFIDSWGGGVIEGNIPIGLFTLKYPDGMDDAALAAAADRALRSGTWEGDVQCLQVERHPQPPLVFGNPLENLLRRWGL